MFADYQARVIENYREKVAAGQLSLRLTAPTASKLKAECMAVCQERYARKDEPILRLFFGAREGQAGYLQAIKTSEADKLKPLLNFLKQATSTTDKKNIELLAWLLDFEPRPYRFDSYNIQAVQNNILEEPATNYNVKPTRINEENAENINLVESLIAGLPETQANTSDENEPTHNQLPQNLLVTSAGRLGKAKWVLWLISGVLIILSAITLWYWHRPFKTALLVSGASSQCMYWAKDHYELTPCNLKHHHVPVVAADTFQVIHMKLITQPDTLTPTAVRKIWYFRNKGKYEFYTAGGTHPVYRNRRLLPVTKRIYEKHIRPL